MSNNSSQKFQILSPVFKDNSNIPFQYTCLGQNINPSISIIGTPKETKSLVLIMHDPDAVSGDFVHWLMWDIPSSTESIPTDSVPVGAIQGKNSSGSNKYIGPCPPSGTGLHHYIFELLALDITLGLDPSQSREQLENATKNHEISKSLLTGLFRANT